MNQFLELMNSKRFRKIKVDIGINATVPRELYLTKFINYTDMVDYVRYMADFMRDVDEKCINGALNVLSIYTFPTYATPSEDTSEDGITMLRIARLWDEVRENEFPDANKYFGFYRGTGDVSKNEQLFINNIECSELRDSFTINYDGSICECNGSFIENFEPYLQELKETNNIDEYYRSKLRNHLVYNPGTATQKEKEHYNWVVHTETQLENAIEDMVRTQILKHIESYLKIELSL